MTFSRSFDKLHHVLVFEFATPHITENVLFWEGSCVGVKFFQACEDCVLVLPIIVKHEQMALSILVNKACKSKEVD